MMTDMLGLTPQTWRIESSLNPRTSQLVWTVRRGDEFLRMDGKFSMIRRFRTEAGALRACAKANRGT